MPRLTSFSGSRGFGRSALLGPDSSSWFSILDGASSESSFGVSLDNSYNIYIAGMTNSTGAGSNDALLAKYTSSGLLEWQKILGGAASDMARSIATDSSNNTYISGLSYTIGGTNGIVFLAKYDPSGNLQWQRSISSTGSSGTGLVTDSSNNVYLICITSSLIQFGNILVSKYDPSGNLQWQRQLDGNSTEQSVYSISTDSDDNVYVGGRSTTADDILLVKYNSSGTLQWQRLLGNEEDNQQQQQQQQQQSGGSEAATAIAVDSNNNIYVFGQTNSTPSGSTDMILAKYNSSGVIQWQRGLGTSSGEAVGYQIAIDINNNIYICGTTFGFSPSRAIIAKYDPSGNLQWQRSIRSTTACFIYGIQADDANNIYVSGERAAADGTDQFLVAKLKNDGSLTGTYTLNGQSLIYENSSLSSYTQSLNERAGTLTSSVSSLSSNVSSLTSSTSNLTRHFVKINT